MARISIDNGKHFFGPDELDRMSEAALEVRTGRIVDKLMASDKAAYDAAFWDCQCGGYNMVDDIYVKCLLRSYLSRASEDVVIYDGLSDMQGSDKQVKWAIDIQDATLDALDYLIGEGQKYKGIPNADAMLNKLASQRDAVAHCEDARDMIDCFAQVARQSNSRDRAIVFERACRIVNPTNPIQYHMLGVVIDKDPQLLDINIDRDSLDRAADATVDYAGRSGCNEICYNLVTGKVSVIARDDSSVGVTRHDDPNMITVNLIGNHVDARSIEHSIIRAVRLIKQYT